MTRPPGGSTGIWSRPRRPPTIFAAPLQLAEPGVVLFGAIVRQDKPLDAALAALLADVENQAAKPITDAEVERGRAQILKQIELNLNDSEHIGLELSNWMGMGDWRLMFLNRDRLRAVKTADVQRAWRAYFKPSNRTAGLYYPTKEPDRAEIPAPPDVVAMLNGLQGRRGQGRRRSVRSVERQHRCAHEALDAAG